MGVSVLAVGLAVAAALLLPAPGAPSVRSVTQGGNGSRRRTGRVSATGPPWPVAAATAAGLWLLVGGWAGAVAGALGGWWVWRVLRTREPGAVRRRREGLRAGLPHAVDLLACCLDAGAAPEQALAVVTGVVRGPVGEELGQVQRRLSLGSDPISTWGAVSVHPELGPLGRALLRALESGSSVAVALHRLADDLRRESRSEAETRARAVGVQVAAPLGLCLLPAFLLLGIVPLVGGLAGAVLGG